MNKFFL